MLDSNEFVDRLITEKYTHLCVVPCSFAKSLINSALNQASRIEYISCASEAVACSIAAGLKMSGQRPIVIVQSSGLTNMGSCITSLLKPYDIYFPMIVSWRTYQPGDSEIQHEHLADHLPDLVHAYGYEYDILDSSNIDSAFEQIEICESRHQLLLLKKSSFSTVEILPELKSNLSAYPKRSEYLEILNSNWNHDECVFIGTTGNTAREMYSVMSNTDNFYMAGNMGGAMSIGLGAAKSGKRTVVCGGDAEFVMHLGGLSTAGRYAECDVNLTYLLFDNESNKSTGGQNTFQSHLDYSAIAQACGLKVVPQTIRDTKIFSQVIPALMQAKGINFVHVKAAYDETMERPSRKVIRESISAFSLSEVEEASVA